MTFRGLVRTGDEVLALAGVPDPTVDATELLLRCFEMTMEEYLWRQGDRVTIEEEERYRALLARRAAREPLQYITGFADFYGRSFFVNRSVLIPRFDSETMIPLVLAELRAGMSLLDLCTGSGCLLLTLLLESDVPLQGTGSDISAEALAVARENAAEFDLTPTLVQSDLFEEIPGKYDIILSNPPYIKSGEIATLMPEVAQHEPTPALDGGEDGLCVYRRLIREAPAHLHPGGKLFLEIGFDEAAAVSGLLAKSGFSSIKVTKDVSGTDRIVSGTYAQ